MLLVMLPVSFVLFHATPCDAGDPCPNKTELAPCTCSQKFIGSEAPTRRPERDTTDNFMITPEFTKKSSLYTVVECLSPKSQNILEEKISSALDRRWVDKLIVSSIPPEKGNTLARFPSDWLKNVRVRQLEVQNTQLCGDFMWNGNFIKDQVESLYWLKINNCYLYGALTYDSMGTVHTKGLNILRRLQGLDLSSNHLTAVLVTAFKAPQLNLSTLVLAKNNIQYIDPGAFLHITFLKHIDLSHNQLTSVLRNYFAAPPKHLEHIDLSWNSLRSIPVDFFLNMPALKYVNVSYNFLFSLPAKPWSLVWKQLLFVDVSGNFVECDCELLWLLPMVLVPNSTVPSTLPGQKVMGRCAQLLMLQENLQTVDHNLISLTRDLLSC